MKRHNPQYVFKLRENTEFTGWFAQSSIKIKPSSFNGTPVDIPITDILKIQRIDDLNWAPPKRKYFIFELRDNVKIAGDPVDKVCSVNLPILKQCKVEFDNMIQVEKVV